MPLAADYRRGGNPDRRAALSGFLSASIQQLTTAANRETGRPEMLEHSDLETTTRQETSARPGLSLTWRRDPVTGKPVAQWVSQRPEPSAQLAPHKAA